MLTHYAKLGSICILFVFFSLAEATNNCLYTVSHRNGEVQMFEMDGTQLILRKETQVDNHGFGAIDMAIDLASSTLFICFEEDIYTPEAEGNIIELLNSHSLEPYVGVDPIVLSGPTDITGLEYDADRQILFCTDRNTNHLYAYTWDADAFTLTPESNNPVELSNIDYACGLARDGDTLYVSQYQYILLGSGVPFQAVQSYDLSDNYNYLGAIAMGNDAIGIAYSPMDNAIYGGAFRNSNYLVKRVVDPNTIIQKDINAYINGVAADDETGLVYVTTQRGTIEVYDTTDWATDPNEEAEPVFTYNAYDAGMAGIEIGGTYKPPLMILTKERTDTLDPNDTVVPNDNITYTICYTPDANDHENVVVIDYLPLSLNWVSANPDTGEYDWVNRRYIWSIPHVEGGSEPNCLEITVQVNTQCNPNGQIKNRVEIESDTSYTVAYEYTNVGCWGGNRIYVNANAVGCNNGVTWEGAYTDLQDALTRAQIDCGYQNSYEIWVARGTYYPGDDTTDSFVIPDNVEVYGGFIGWEANLEERDFTLYKTILNGYVGIDTYGFKQYAQKTVTMGDETNIDGFVVEDAGRYGIESDIAGNDSVIVNCIVKENDEIGIHCQNGNLIVSWCSIKENGYDGIYHYGNGNTLYIYNCDIHDNLQNGIFSQYSTTTILNSVIHHNASEIMDYYGNTYHGIRLYQPSNTPVIRGNTIAYNYNEGIYFTGVNSPEINNCILWGNDENGGGFQLNGCLPTYSCYYDPNDPNSSCTPDPTTHNIKCDPLFACPNHEEYDNYHLDPNSPCIDRGDDDFAGIEYEKDMDDANRVYGDTVDMGADEVDCEDVYNPLDWNADGIVNMPELAKFSAAWLSTDPNNDPNYAENWDPECDINDDLIVDIEDLASLADEWLWKACWIDPNNLPLGMMMMAPSGGGGMELSAVSWSAKAVSVEEEAVEEAVPLATLEEMTAWLEEIYGDNEEFQLGYFPQEWQDFIDEVKVTWYESY